MMDDYDLHLGWNFTRTLEQELGIATDLAERIQELVETSGHYPTREELVTAWGKMDELESEKEELSELVREYEGVIAKVRAAVELS